MKSRSLAAFS